MKMSRIITGTMLLMAMVAASFMAGADGEGQTSSYLSAQKQVGRQVVGTKPRGHIERPEDRARKYRSCLFTYLPRMGSDVAAELIRDACKAEYL